MNRIILFAGLCLLVALSGCDHKKKEIHESGKFTVTSPIKVDTSYDKEYVSQIQSFRNIEIRAQEKGYLEKINVDEGQHVRAGQVLFRIMPKLYEAEYLKAQAETKAAELEMMNTKTLADKKIVSDAELKLAQAKLEGAKANLSLAKIHLSFTEITAPFDGTIDRIRFKLGSLIDEGSLLTSLSDNKNVFAYFNVSEAEYLNYRLRSNADQKTSASLILANNEPYKYKGVVETIESEFDNTTGNIAFRAKFPNPDNLLRHGETGKVQIRIPLAGAIVIPQKATYEIQDKIYVYVVDKNNVVRSKGITVKASLPDLYVVDKGLCEDDRILLEGVQNVKDDDKIQYAFVEPRRVINNLQLIR